MKIGIAGAMSLDMLNIDYKGAKLPDGAPFPMISHIINALIEQGNEVVAYTLSKHLDEPVVYQGEKLTVCVAKRLPHAGRDFFKSERRELMEMMRKYPVDIINAQWSYEYAWAAIDSKIPTIVTLRDHASTIMSLDFSFFQVMRWIMNKIVMRKARHLITNSAYLKNLLTHKQQQKAVVIHNFYPLGLEKEYDQEQKKENFIISVSNFYGKRKNLDSAILAFKEIRKNFPDLQYYLLGKGSEEGGEAFQFAQKNNALDGLVFKGRLPFSEVIGYLKKAKVFVHPSKEESFGNVILEAMVVGTPVVAGSKSGNVPDLLEKGSVGELCDINSPHAIAQAISKILHNTAYAQSLQEKAHLWATQQYSQHKIVENLINHYQKVLSQYVAK